MNYKIGVLALFLFLKVAKSSTERSSTTKFNTISYNRAIALYNNATLDRISSKKISSGSPTNIVSKPNKKWKIGRVTNKQFGIINILWQKTKVFVEQDFSNLTCKATTIEMTPDVRKDITTKKRTLKLSTYQTKLQTSTPSYIEFYYLDQADDRIKRKHPSNTKLQKLKKGNRTKTDRSNNKKSSIASSFKIKTNTVRRKHTPQPSKSVQKVGQGNFYRNKLNKSKRTTFVAKTPLTIATKTKIKSSKQPKKNRSQHTVHFFTQNTPVYYKMKQGSKVFQSKNNSYTTKLITDRKNVTKNYFIPNITSTAYDKVKFFEIYDYNTPRLQNHIISNLNNNVSYYNNIKKINDRDDEQILLHHVNENIGHHQDKNKTRYVKKHIQDLYSKEVISKGKIQSTKHFSKYNLNFSSSTSKFPVASQKNFNKSRPVLWTEFPFVAAYIYEPSHVHCDAAGLSPHWLLGAASCLSRHRKGLRSGGLSAFVTFCGDNWTKSRIISYVKRTVIHPLYHPKDKIRRLYNAGLIQVVNSMADTCSGWGPASLTSHQYATDEKGSIGRAIGWGLDRYGERYTTNIPSHALMMYEGRVFSQTCPGNTEYSLTKTFDEGGIRNIYCLLLPPYFAEENDTVHGALLLIEGKLLALYLQEERRPWGMQSAQYTGIWRLLPWLAETAREPDESFQFEI